jgi:type II secretory pathway component GspD/PulD (secretin)
VVTRRTATSSVRVKDGGTVAIAGLLDTRTRRNDQSVPGFSQLPGVGLLFRNRRDNDTTEEVAIFVTARLIPDAPVKPEKDRGKRSIPQVDVEVFREQLRKSYDRLHK